MKIDIVGTVGPVELVGNLGFVGRFVGRFVGTAGLELAE